jgi:hypothetical protein
VGGLATTQGTPPYSRFHPQLSIIAPTDPIPPPAANAPPVTDTLAELAKVPIYTASDLVLHLRGIDAYAVCPDKPPGGPRRVIVSSLAEDEKQCRLKSIQDRLHFDNLTEKAEELATNNNVRYIIVKKMTFSDL